MAPSPLRRPRNGILRLFRELLPFAAATLVLFVLANIFWVVRLAPKVGTTDTSAKHDHSELMSVLDSNATVNHDHDHSKHAMIDVDSNSFSACLLVMDDNHRLVEWLAYHYFLFPLRHLVILPDSNSRTSPNEVLDRWRSLMNIEVWTDDDYMDDNLRNYIKDKDSNPFNGFLVHTHRQEAFYKRCALHLQEQKRTWVTFSKSRNQQPNRRIPNLPSTHSRSLPSLTLQLMLTSSLLSIKILYMTLPNVCSSRVAYCVLSKTFDRLSTIIARLTTARALPPIGKPIE
jgi:hypothetical protein